ncbi:hypothetical protein [Galbibacter mesophilus]|uniref:hypothetical protein n=1 Tax=Galbibacter mesophilus TaxID=379069 RepID=UPI00191DC969|nr:hypothetical protein [Galbibacter mesophilus]MCM5663374.1 hypothetical protein [Galbibacter mesophilus]
MKTISNKKYLVLFLLYIIVGCTQESKSSNQVTDYYQGFKNSNYDLIRSTIADSLVIIEGSQELKFSRESYYSHFKWDSVFQPEYTIKNITRNNEKILATVSLRSSRLEFLENNPLTCTYEFHFKSNKINKIVIVNCDADWKIWQNRRDLLVNWVKNNYPKYGGFINDLSMDGATNYLKAISLYKKENLKNTP